MENKLHLKPAAGLIVRDPQTGKPLAEGGEEKPDTPYWRRRLRDGDAVLMGFEQEPAEPAKKKAAAQPNAKANGGKPK